MIDKPRREAPDDDALVVLQTNATGETALWEKTTNQSAADRNGVSLADYIHAMLSFIVQAKSRHVLMIGCGGGTLATMLYQHGVRVTMVDINAQSFAIARQYFQVPYAVECHVEDGARFLRTHRTRYDAIVLDAYSDDSLPDCFARKAFFDLAKSRLKHGGIFLMNLLVANDEDPAPDNMVRLLRRTWRNVRLLDSDGWDDRNAVAIAGAVTKLKRPKILMPPARGAKKFAADFKSLRFRKLRSGPQ